MNTLLHGCHNPDTDARKVIRPYIEPGEDCDHPLNHRDKSDAELRRLFGEA